MEKELIHLAPFDIGCSFFDFEYQKKNNKDAFITKLSELCQKHNYEILRSENKSFLLYVRISDIISCYLLECGIGVFVFRNLNLTNLTEIQNTFKDNFECELYYQKKIEQNSILNQMCESVLVKEFMHDVWNSVEKKIRPYSANENYKHHGLSYVLSVYHIIDETKELFSQNNKSIDLLMNPSILSKICDESQWISITDKMKKYKNKGYTSLEFTDSTNIAASWSAVAVIDEKESIIINRIVDYEITLQASWFLFDCLIDNIKNSQLSNLDLQKEKSLATNVSLEISSILSANMSSSEKNALESIYKTSGFETLKDKLFLLLENRIAIAEAKISHRQGIYGIITEILLVLFTLVSIYEPIKNLFNGTIATADIVIGIIMLIIFIICSILIIGKEK